MKAIIEPKQTLPIFEINPNKFHCYLKSPQHNEKIKSANF